MPARLFCFRVKYRADLSQLLHLCEALFPFIENAGMTVTVHTVHNDTKCFGIICQKDIKKSGKIDQPITFVILFSKTAALGARYPPREVPMTVTSSKLK